MADIQQQTREKFQLLFGGKICETASDPLGFKNMQKFINVQVQTGSKDVTALKSK